MSTVFSLLSLTFLYTDIVHPVLLCIDSPTSLSLLGSDQGEGVKGGKNKKGENHCSATHLGLALVTNVVSVFWGVFFCFSLTLVIFLKEKRRNWATFERCSSRFAAQRMKMKSPSAKYAQLDTGYHWFGGISSCVRFKNVHFNHDVSHDVFDH